MLHKKIWLAGVLSLALAGACQAGDFPSKPITAVVPYAAGGLTDQLAREVGARMAKSLGQPVVVENRPGGAAQIAMNYLKQAPADGYLLFFGDVPSLATNLGLFPKLSYDPRHDLRPVTQLIESPALVVVPNDRPYRDFPSLVEAARRQTLAYASQGMGTGGQLFGTLLSAKIGAPMTHVAYRGSTPGLADVMSGQVDFMYDAIPTSGVYAKAGKLRALAIGSQTRSPLLPEVPTLSELGYASIVPTFWWGVAVKAGTPEPVVAKLHDAIVAAITDPEVAGKFTGQGVLIKTSTPDAFAAYIDSEITRWTAVMKEAGMSAQ